VIVAWVEDNMENLNLTLTYAIALRQGELGKEKAAGRQQEAGTDGRGPAGVQAPRFEDDINGTAGS
jgi:hypothetical protein